jgi:UvrB/uvrC motif
MGDEAENLWHRLEHTKRKIKVAIAEEDYGLAAQLRDEIHSTAKQPVPVHQFVFFQLETLSSDSDSRTKLAAIQALGNVFIS